MAGLMASSDPVPVVILVGIGIVVGIVLLVLNDNRRKAMGATLQRIAYRIGGRASEGSMWSEPSLEFKIEDRHAVLNFFGGSKNSSPYSRVTLDVRGVSPGQLHILEDGFGQSFMKLFGAQDLNIGDPSFDADYVIKAMPESVASQVFRSDRRREAIRAVRRIKSYIHPTVDLDHQQLTVKVRQYLRNEADLLELIAAAREFAACAIVLPKPAGIVLGEVRVSTGGDCPVCGTAMQQDVLRCESCRTPHHRECWEYMGRCSTYACKGTRGVA
jgi:hypothetical protein